MLLFSLISLHFKYIKSGLTLRNRIVYPFLSRYILSTILTGAEGAQRGRSQLKHSVTV